MICSRCSALPIQDPSFNGSVQHCPTFTELDKSVQNGCHICKLFKRVLLEYYTHGLSSSVKEVEYYQRQLDQEPERRDDENLNPQEKKPEQDLRPTAFFVKFCHLEIDSNFAPYDRGLRGILYLRKHPGEDSFPVNHIYPFLEVSSLPSRYTFQPQYYTRC